MRLSISIVAMVALSEYPKTRTLLCIVVIWELIALFSSVTPWATDWPNVRFPRLVVSGQNCSGVNRPCGMAPGKRRWMYEALTSDT